MPRSPALPPAARARLTAAARGADPLVTLDFLATDILPDLRLLPRGVWDVRRGEVRRPARRRRG